MNPTHRPSFDPNAPYRNTIQALADGYNVIPNNTITDRPSTQQHPFEGLRTNIARTQAPPAQTSAQPANDIGLIFAAFSRAGINYKNPINEAIVRERLDRLNIRPETLFNAIQIANTTDHPMMVRLGANSDYSKAILSALAGIIRHQGMNKPTQAVANTANDNPYLLVSGIFDNLRAGVLR